MHITADAEREHVQLGEDVSQNGALDGLEAVTGPRKDRVQRLAEYREYGVQDAAEEQTVPGGKELVVVVHEDPGAAPMGDSQRADHEQREERVTDMQQPLRAPVRAGVQHLVGGLERIEFGDSVNVAIFGPYRRRRRRHILTRPTIIVGHITVGDDNNTQSPGVSAAGQVSQQRMMGHESGAYRYGYSGHPFSMLHWAAAAASRLDVSGSSSPS